MDTNLKNLINKIKSKKYKTLSDDLIELEIENYLKSNIKATEKQIIKAVKGRLHKIYGSFQIKKRKKRGKYIKDPKKALGTNLSTKERINIYKELYKKIFQITGKPKTILDIGAGMNPISYKFLGVKPKYIAIEIDKEDVKFLNNFFKINKINGKAILMHINEKNIKKLPKSDLTFLFKAIDPIEIKKGHKLAEKLVKELKSKNIIISFPTKTISQKQMNYPQRGWIEQMLKRLKLEFKILKYPNEIFYIIKK